MKQVEYGRERTTQDGSRRYLPHAISFNTRAFILTTEINLDWEPEIIAQHQANRRQARMRLIHEFGNDDHDRKIQDYSAVGVAPWSVVDQHNVFMTQIRTHSRSVRTTRLLWGRALWVSVS